MKICSEGFGIAHKSSINGQLRGFYFAASGDNAFDGQTIERPKLTIQAAIDAAASISPPPSPVDIALVTVSQGGSFTESMVLVDSVQFNGTDVSILNDDAVTAELASFAAFDITTISNTAAGGTCVMIDGTQSTGLNAKFLGTSGGGATAVKIQGEVNNLFLTVSQAALRGDGDVGLHITATSNTPIDGNANSIALIGDDTSFLIHNPGDDETTTVLDVSSITDVTPSGARSTGSSALSNIAGHLIVQAESIEASTVFDASGGIAHVQLVDAVGNIDITGTGTLSSFEGACLIGNISVAADNTLNSIILEQVGDITNDGTLNAIILDHDGTLTNNGTINGIINGVRYGNWRITYEDILTDDNTGQVVVDLNTGNVLIEG